MANQRRIATALSAEQLPSECWKRRFSQEEWPTSATCVSGRSSSHAHTAAARAASWASVSRSCGCHSASSSLSINDQSTAGQRLLSSASGRLRSHGCTPRCSRASSCATKGTRTPANAPAAVSSARVRGDTTTSSRRSSSGEAPRAARSLAA